VKKAVEVSTGGPGKKSGIDFASIEQLVAMKRPLSANEFHRRLYRAFGDNVVDDLFDYYNNINLLWDGFTSLGAKTAGPARHEALGKSAAAADGLLNTDYGMVLSKNGEQLAGGLVFLNIVPQKPAEAAATEKADKKGKKKGGKDKAADEGIKVKVSSSQGGQEVERTLYTGQDGLGESFEKYVFIVDKVRSRTILGETANLFAKFRADLMDLNARMDKTTEVQGRLTKELAPFVGMYVRADGSLASRQRPSPDARACRRMRELAAQAAERSCPTVFAYATKRSISSWVRSPSLRGARVIAISCSTTGWSPASTRPSACSATPSS
jgi:hypothetical protein